jgi:hypothetical protein
MTSKKEKIVVSDLRHINGYERDCFKVVKAVNTIKFPIGKYLSSKEVEDEIKYNSDMTVDIVPQKK